MCGICGYAGDNRPELLGPMCSVMTYRGPDDAGAWNDSTAGVGLGHRRLSIIDLSPAGHQPMASVDGRVRISYNGEIYNYRELRKQLEFKGYSFRSNSDTEVLLNLYLEYGREFLKLINGIFAIAIWDGRFQQLFLIRDHAGVKPLYYWKNGSKIYFSSEIKSLFCIPEFSRSLNEKAIPEYFTFLWVPGDQTMLRDVYKLEPGHWLLWEKGKTVQKRWFDINYYPEKGVSENEWIERVESSFNEAIERQMVADVKVGAFLSGGLDSSAIVAAMRQAYPEREIDCYTTSYDPNDLKREGIVDDLPYARQVAHHLGVNLHEVQVTPDILALLPKMVYHMDEPDADPSAILTYLISKLGHSNGCKVLMSGTGGDEVLFGYRSHQAYRYLQKLSCMPAPVLGAALSGLSNIGKLFSGAQGSIARRAEKLKSSVLSKDLKRHIAMVDWSSPEIRELLFLKDYNKEDSIAMQRYYDDFVGAGQINRHSYLLTQTFLAAHNFLYNDKCAMATSVEVRVPFMDVDFMRLCAKLPETIKLKNGITKFPLKEAMRNKLPGNVIDRPKTGFTPPLREWMISGLGDAINDLLGDRRMRERGIFDSSAVEKIVSDNMSNKSDHGYLIYSLISFEIWQQTFIDQPGVEVVI